MNFNKFIIRSQEAVQKNRQKLPLLQERAGVRSLCYCILKYLSDKMNDTILEVEVDFIRHIIRSPAP